MVEPGTSNVNKVHSKALNGEAVLSFSLWNIGEVLGVLDKYYRRRLEKQDYERAGIQFIANTEATKAHVLRVVPVKAGMLIVSWLLIEKRHLYEAGTLQVILAKTRWGYFTVYW